MEGLALDADAGDVMESDRNCPVNPDRQNLYPPGSYHASGKLLLGILRRHKVG